jgi:hypothetical protein
LPKFLGTPPPPPAAEVVALIDFNPPPPFPLPPITTVLYCDAEFIGKLL